MSTEEITPETLPLTLIIKLYNSNKSLTIPFPPNRTLFDLKTAILLLTSWFPDDCSPSQIVLYEEGEQGKTDSPTALQKESTLIVRRVPNNSLPIQVSDERGYVSNPWMRPLIDASTFSFIDSKVNHILLADTSVVKAVMLREITSLPLSENLLWVSTRKVKEECKSDIRLQPLHNFWPNYIMDCNNLIQGFTLDRKFLLFKMVYQKFLGNTCFSGYIFPSYDEFESSDDFTNTCNDLVILFEALIMCHHLRKRFPALKVTFVTFDRFQGAIANSLKQDAMEILKLIVEPTDIEFIQIMSLPNRQFVNL